MATTDMWWATTSCSSRAIVVRSSSRVRRDRSCAVTVCWAVTSCTASRRMCRTVTQSRISAEMISMGPELLPYMSRGPIPVSAMIAYSAVSTHIHPAVRGLVRIATTVSTVRWQTKLPAAHGHSNQRLPTTATSGVETMDAQNAPTGRTMVSSTGTAQNRPISTAGPPESTVAKATVIRAAATIRACGVQAAYSRRRPGSRRANRPSVRRPGSGR
ncbi:hypothetical protein SPURM210S_07755 [Streptomyces purpurascens]